MSVSDETTEQDNDEQETTDPEGSEQHTPEPDGSRRDDSEPERAGGEAPKKRAPRKRAPAKRARAASKTSAPAPKRVPAMKVARLAAQQLAELTGRTPESVIGISRTDDGFKVELEVVESRRIPDSADILATYEVETDGDGDLVGYHRARRYLRGKGSDGDGR